MSSSMFDNIECLDFDAKIVTALRRARLTNPKNLLTLSNSEVQRLSRLSSKDVQHVKDLIAERLMDGRTCSALELLDNKADTKLQHWKLPTTCQNIDNVLRGGFLSGVITEVSGESACGKTQLCLQLCISVQLLEQHSGGAVYICTEDVFPSKRLQQLIQHHSSKANNQNLGDKIFIEHVADFETLDFCVNKKLPALLNRGLVKLVVIDSVTALFRCQYDVTQTFERSKHLIKFASLLHHLAFEHNIPVICVNQVSANMSSSGIESSSNSVIPALGLTWANQVTCRITMARTSGLSDDVQRHLRAWKTEQGRSLQYEPTYRKLNVVFAPHMPQNELKVYIDHCGIHGVPC